MLPVSVAESSLAGASLAAGARVRVLFVIPGVFAGNSMIFARRQALHVRQAGVRVAVFHLRSRTSPAALLREALRFRKWVRRFDPDLIHAHFGTATAFFTAVAGWDRPLLITYRGSDLNPAPRGASPAEKVRAWLGRCLSQVAALRASHIVCVSRGLRERLWWRRDRVSILPSGVDAEQFQPRPWAEARAKLGWSSTERVVLFNAGHDSHVKRLDLARASIILAASALPGLRLEVLDGGTPPEEIPLHMNAADCLLVASDAEGSPTVLQEALACNLPIVSVDAGDAIERLRGVSRSLIAARDPKAIAGALIEILKTPGRSDGRRNIHDFSAHRIGDELCRIYSEVLRAASPPRRLQMDRARQGGA